MKKLLALLLTCTLSLALLAGCGQTEPAAEETPDAQTETDTTTDTGDLERRAWTRSSRPSRAVTPPPPSSPGTPSSP